MNSDDIKNHWMHIGKSSKEYEIIDENNNKRILAGSKGIGRFALSRLGKNIQMFSKKFESTGVIWVTDWNSSVLSEDRTLNGCGTKIIINNLREKWGKKRIENLIEFISKTYNDNSMKIKICYADINEFVPRYFPEPKLGKNCLSTIQIKFDSYACELITKVQSDEFLDEAQAYCPEIDIKNFRIKTDIIDEFKSFDDFDLTIGELQEYLNRLGDFSAEMYFNIKSPTVDMGKFLYKYSDMPESLKSGIILYRNAFSISSYEGKKDWLGLGKRSRKSPAAASHPTGAWRVRENQLAGKVEIDKKRNAVLQDLSNRQGIDESIYYHLFIEIILTGIKEFERYRQGIIRLINIKNKSNAEKADTPVSDKVISNPKLISQFSIHEANQLANEIKTYRKERYEYKKEKDTVEEQYKYDVRILNVLATTGLKASSIAHEMKNDRNSIAISNDNIISALKEYGMWEELTSPEKTKIAYKNVPDLIHTNKKVTEKIITFMDTMLTQIEKKQFEAKFQNIADLLNNIKKVWERDYAWVTLSIKMEEDIYFFVSEDIICVIFDNLILNSIQQNESTNHLAITISAKQIDNLIYFVYSDNGKGLDKKYDSNPRKILEVHETTRKNGHGLGMWIVNNSAVMSGGEVLQINGKNGFALEFSVGGKV